MYLLPTPNSSSGTDRVTCVGKLSVTLQSNLERRPDYTRHSHRQMSLLRAVRCDRPQKCSVSDTI